MRIATLAVLLSALLAGAQAPAADHGAVGDTTAAPSRGYASPRDAFHAMRTALDRRDWPAAFSSLTPASRDAQVFALFDTCTFREERNPKVRAAMKEYGLEMGKVMAEYTKEYRRKHGVDPDKLGAES